MSEIIEKKLWIGNIGDCTNAVNGGFDVVLCLTQKNMIPKVKHWYHFPEFEDTADFPIEEYLDKTYEIIDKHITAGEKILVNCTAGICRSPAIVVAYLMKKNGWQYETAFNYVSDRRPKILLREEFIAKLKK
jgi:protein-tyrosine phosphatase